MFVQAVVVLGYGILAIGLTWPLARDFSTRLVGHVPFDMRHAIWVLWYGKEVLLGGEPWPYTRLLHYPYGINTLVDGVGPLNAVLALPFWSWGPAAAYNGTVFLGVTLSGYFMYLLARYVRLDLPAALFAGALYTAWPIHLSGLYGHLEKCFTGLLPLTVLTGLAALDVRRRWGIIALPVVLLLTLVQNGNQFIFALLALGVVTLQQVVLTPRPEWWAQARRVALVAGSCAAICLPPAVAIVRRTRHPWMKVDLGEQSQYYSPDLLQFLTPSIHQLVPERWFYPDPNVQFDFTRNSVIPALSLMPGRWYGSGIETSVTIPLTVLLLAVAACWTARRQEARRWLLMGALFALLSMGPLLRVAGRTEFTASMTQITLPYATLVEWPGLRVMRTPGRFMMVASIGFSLAAGIGLAALLRRGRRGPILASTVAAIAVLEMWPANWPQQALLPIPDFYQRISRDSERYAVLDLPAGWLGRNDLSSAYMFYQLTHHKPIAWAYLSRTYIQYPRAGLDSLWTASTGDYEATRKRLVQLGYRYVVWHKLGEELFRLQRITPTEERVGRAALPSEMPAFLREAFRNELPIVDDHLTTVFDLR